MRRAGFTIIEILAVTTIIGTLATIAIPKAYNAIDRAKGARAADEIRHLEAEIAGYSSAGTTLPNALTNLGPGTYLDPWGNPYQYLNQANSNGNGQSRKDRFLVPLNTDYDLYSMGPDGQSVGPLTAKASLDDIVRANDGGYVGLAALY